MLGAFPGFMIKVVSISSNPSARLSENLLHFLCAETSTKIPKVITFLTQRKYRVKCTRALSDQFKSLCASQRKSPAFPLRLNFNRKVSFHCTSFLLSLGCNRSQRLPYKSSKTATVPYASSFGCLTKRIPRSRICV